jgi:hypothetical protein
MRANARGHEVSARNHARLAFGTGAEAAEATAAEATAAEAAAAQATAAQATAARAARAVGNDNPRDGHRLCNLSYFEFYRPASVGGNPNLGLFIQQYPPALPSDACKVISREKCPLRPGDKLFKGITALDVRNLLRSLTDSVVVVDRLGDNDADYDLARTYTKNYIDPRSSTARLEFGFTDILWMLNGGKSYLKDGSGGKLLDQSGRPRYASFVPDGLSSSATIAEYLNNLEVKGTNLVEGSWNLTVSLPKIEGVYYGDDGDATTLLAYCRASSSPQRTLDVVPLLLMKKGDSAEICEIMTTRSERATKTVTVDNKQYAAVGLAFQGTRGGIPGARPARTRIIGAGEHVEPSDGMKFDASSGMPLVRDGTRRSLAELLKERARAPRPELVEGGMKSKDRSAIRRALDEEVGLSSSVLDRARMWMVGRHETTDTDAVARDPRYWPRRLEVPGESGEAAEVEYGYRRNCATIVFVAVVDIDPTTDMDLKPRDDVEINAARPIEWREAVRTFRDDAGDATARPAFGWAHQRMVEIVNGVMPEVVETYVAEHRGLKLAKSLLGLLSGNQGWCSMM